ncbi:MAG: zinc ribbon domain-containing protein [Fibrobacteria bacterium]|nr:zinc ribbon domain-containing protein [Fibrobacteria bacterium]
MPTYVYRLTDLPEEDPNGMFEVRQSIHDAPLTHHPETGAPVERVLCAPALLGGASAPVAPASSGGHRHGPSCGCGH